MCESAAGARHYEQRRYRETDAHSHCTFLRNRRQALPEKRSSPDSCLSLRRERSLGTKPFLTRGVESEVDVATALTRARQARLPSPWTEAVDFLDLGPRASKKVEHWRARLLRKTEKIDSLCPGRGIWTLAALKNALCEYRRSICASTR